MGLHRDQLGHRLVDHRPRILVRNTKRSIHPIGVGIGHSLFRIRLDIITEGRHNILDQSSNVRLILGEPLLLVKFVGSQLNAVIDVALLGVIHVEGTADLTVGDRHAKNNRRNYGDNDDLDQQPFFAVFLIVKSSFLFCL